MSESFWLLPFFFVAIAAGFFLGRRESKRRQRRRMASLSKDYVAGINFFLNEEPDKGIEALLKSLRSQETGKTLASEKVDRKRIRENLLQPTPNRLAYIRLAFLEVA